MTDHREDFARFVTGSKPKQLASQEAQAPLPLLATLQWRRERITAKANVMPTHNEAGIAIAAVNWRKKPRNLRDGNTQVLWARNLCAEPKALDDGTAD